MDRLQYKKTAIYENTKNVEIKKKKTKSLRKNKEKNHRCIHPHSWIAFSSGGTCQTTANVQFLKAPSDVLVGQPNSFGDLVSWTAFSVTSCECDRGDTMKALKKRDCLKVCIIIHSFTVTHYYASLLSDGRLFASKPWNTK